VRRVSVRFFKETSMNAYFKLLSPGLCLLCLASLAGQEKVTADKLPEKVAQALKRRFPAAQVQQITRETEDGKVVYDIELLEGGTKHEMDCRDDGAIVDIQNEIPVKDLPAAAVTAITAKHPGSRIKEVGEILVVRGTQETRDHFEVLIEDANQKVVELTVALDGKILE
jgi:hypothetical protein